MPRDERARIDLPVRPFFWTMDQVAVIMNLDLRFMKNSGYFYYEGRSTGLPARDQLKTCNVAPADQRPEWRIAEKEFLRWIRSKGFKYYDSGTVR